MLPTNSHAPAHCLQVGSREDAGDWAGQAAKAGARSDDGVAALAAGVGAGEDAPEAALPAAEAAGDQATDLEVRAAVFAPALRGDAPHWAGNRLW